MAAFPPLKLQGSRKVIQIPLFLVRIFDGVCSLFCLSKPPKCNASCHHYLHRPTKTSQTPLKTPFSTLRCHALGDWSLKKKTVFWHFFLDNCSKCDIILVMLGKYPTVFAPEGARHIGQQAKVTGAAVPAKFCHPDVNRDSTTQN